MFTPWRWAHTSNATAVRNARGATAELSRRRVEHDEVELYLTRRRRAADPRPA